MLEKGLLSFREPIAQIERRLERIERSLDELVKLHRPAEDTFPKEILLTQDELRKASMPMLLDLADACKLKLSAEEKVSATTLRARIERYAQKRGQILEPKLVSDPPGKFTKEDISKGKKAVKEMVQTMTKDRKKKRKRTEKK